MCVPSVSIRGEGVGVCVLVFCGLSLNSILFGDGDVGVDLLVVCCFLSRALARIGVAVVDFEFDYLNILFLPIQFVARLRHSALESSFEQSTFSIYPSPSPPGSTYSPRIRTPTYPTLPLLFHPTVHTNP
jgi:hypothetical protein